MDLIREQIEKSPKILKALSYAYRDYTIQEFETLQATLKGVDKLKSSKGF